MIHSFKAELIKYHMELVSKLNFFYEELNTNMITRKMKNSVEDYKEELSNLGIYDDNRFSYLGRVYLKKFVVEKMIDFHVDMLIQRMLLIHENYDEVVDIHSKYKEFLYKFASQYEELIKEYLLEVERVN